MVELVFASNALLAYILAFFKELCFPRWECKGRLLIRKNKKFFVVFECFVGKNEGK